MFRKRKRLGRGLKSISGESDEVPIPYSLGRIVQRTDIFEKKKEGGSTRFPDQPEPADNVNAMGVITSRGDGRTRIKRPRNGQAGA